MVLVAQQFWCHNLVAQDISGALEIALIAAASLLQQMDVKQLCLKFHSLAMTKNQSKNQMQNHTEMQ